MEQNKGNALDRYQEAAGRTRNSKLIPALELSNYGLGLGGEAGEVQELIKKYIGHGHDLAREDLVKELGDVLWYLSNIAAMNDIKLSEVAAKNIDKLKKRYPSGFDEGKSINRNE